PRPGAGPRTLVADLVIVAGEASGDQLAADLVQRLRRVRPDLRFHGVTGPKMRASGVVSWGGIDTLAVRGLVEVLPALPRILRLKREILARTAALKPVAYIGVDAPDFNLRIERELKAGGLITMHYVAPTFWAWRPERAARFHEAVDHMLCIFPFEPELLAPHQVAATFVGHPLTRARLGQADRKRLKRTLLPEGADLATPIVAVLPGSRDGEVNQHARLMVEAMRNIARALPEVHFAIPLATRSTRLRFETELWARAETLVGQTRLLYGHADYALRAADAAIVASGTATLEAAMLGCPQVVTYRLNPLTAWLIQRKLMTRWVAQPNIVAQADVVPERLQRAATPERLAADVLDLLGDETRRAAMRAAYVRIRELLTVAGEAGEDVLVASVLRVLDRRGASPG
ncbi:MAG: lipid-A-disaccharide synthase, partial [Casimicrobiaceae bacterium]